MRRRGRNRLAPSFFPFISVLIAIIGSLIFMTLTMTLTALDPVLIIESPMEWVPDEDGLGGTERRRRYVMIECADDRAVLLAAESGGVVERLVFDADSEWNNIVEVYRRLQKDNPESWKGTPYLDLLNEISAKSSTHFINFLVRPSGIHPYSMLSDILKMRNGIEINEETYPGVREGWSADWSLVYVQEDREVMTR